MSDNSRRTSEALVRASYRRAVPRIEAARARIGRPLTLTEKILAGHMVDPAAATVTRGEGYNPLVPDRVAMPDSTAQMVLLQFMTSGLYQVAVPASVHCDHLIQARTGAGPDLLAARQENDEVYEFLRDGCRKYGIGFWGPGSGIIHQVFFNNYAFPGGMLLGTDSHTPMAGGMGMLGIGVGGGDAVDSLAGRSFGLPMPGIIGVRLTGALGGWTSPKDVVLALAGILSVKGGTGSVIEYFGPGVASISATGRGTICNMGAEVGATSSVFPFDEVTARHLRSTDRAGIAELAAGHAEHLRADSEVEAHPERFYDRVIEIDLSALEQQIVGPHSPDAARGVSRMSAVAAAENHPTEISQAFIGSCTNSSYEDMGRAADVARQARAAGLRLKSPLFVTPGSEQVRATIERDGLLADLEAIGAKVLANACGPCIGQWKRTDGLGGTSNVILSSFNRNFPRRNDGHAETLAFLASPETVIAAALAGRVDFDPRSDELPGGVRLRPPVADDAPAAGYADGHDYFHAPSATPDEIVIEVDPASERLQLLEAFPAWDGADLAELPVLFKAKGKCTTDHISAAGSWLRYRGHLERISANTFLGVNNAFGGGAGEGLDQLTGEWGKLPEIARRYRDAGLGWVAVGDENYGEGSSREHAAMQPRHLGCRAVVARGFARIHETNLKSQGVLPLTLTDPGDYERIRCADRISVTGLSDLRPGAPLHVVLHHEDGTRDEFPVRHSLSHEQIEWFRAGSAMNALRRTLSDATAPAVA
ncbi:aconitate hydratase [Kitasatospora sp. NPDC058190]|uniref:aconitate hydratase n=1 Tax=Kitasatospora sp. NPDC058190 TaxID=3346371 RepID=UPI0036DD9DA3